MDKLVAIKIKISDNPLEYSDPIPIGTDAANITYSDNNLILADVIENIETDLSNITTALFSDVGKVPKVKTVQNGKVVEWEFDEINNGSGNIQNIDWDDIDNRPSINPGMGTNVNHRAQHVFGQYNISDSSPTTLDQRGNYIEIIGNGSNNLRSNARTLDWDGNEVLAGKLTIGTSPVNNMDVATKKYVDDMVTENTDPIIISETINQFVTDWLDDHIDSSSDVVIDDSLTVTGAAADAKATGDKIDSTFDVLYNGLETTIGFDDIQFTTGYYQKTDGTTEANNNFMISDFIKVFDGLGFELTYTIHGYNNVGMICLFASDKTTVKRCIYKTTEQDLTGTITFEDGEEYIRFCRWSTSKGSNDTLSMQTMMNVPVEIQRIDSEMAVIGETQWNGKVWHCFGTSISNTRSGEGKYPPYLAALSGLQHVNYGYSGGKMTQQILAQIKGDSSIANADLITVEGFVNDWAQQSVLGNITDTTPDTFYGALYDAITYILSNTNATLVFITDTTGRNYNIDLRREAVRNGHTQNDFIEATIKMCEYMGVPVIDAGRKSCISQDTASLYLADQIHQTQKGGEQYAQTIWSELKNIKPRIK